MSLLRNIRNKIIGKFPKSTVLLAGILLFLFVLPLIKHHGLNNFLNALSYSLMLLATFLIIDNGTRFLKYINYITFIFIWLMFFMTESFAVKYAMFSFSVLVFLVSIFIMIKQIIKSKVIDSNVIINTINGYLLIGIIFGFLNSIVMLANPEAINMASTSLSNIMYYSFITLTTVGYGEITPLSPGAKVLAVFFAIVSQLYLTIIMGLIIGKFLNSSNSKQ